MVENPLDHPITTLEESLISGMLTLGCIFGPLIGGLTAKKIGRKPTLLVAACPMLIGFLIKSFATNVYMFYAGRFLVGIATGILFTVVPMYLGEISEDHNRGAVSGTLVVFGTSGSLFAFVIGPFTTIKIFSLICIVPILLFLVLFTVLCPESPLYLASSKTPQKLKASLIKLRNKPDKEIEEEAQKIQVSVEKTVNHNEEKLFNVLGIKSTRRGLVLCTCTVIVQQFAGINSIVSYLQPIFELSAASIPPEISPIIIGIVQVVVTTISSLIVDRLGRKSLLISSAIGVSASLTILGLYFYINLTNLRWLPISSLVMYMIFFNIGLAPIPWTLMTEFFPPDVKSITSTLLTTFCFICAFLTVVFFPVLILEIGIAGSLWIFSVVTCVGSVVIWRYLPETKGKRLEDIIQLLEGK